MYHLTCKDVSGIDCSFEAKGDSEQEVMDDLKEHGMAKHAEEIQKMMADGMSQEDMEAKMQMMITMS